MLFWAFNYGTWEKCDGDGNDDDDGNDDGGGGDGDGDGGGGGGGGGDGGGGGGGGGGDGDGDDDDDVTFRIYYLDVKHAWFSCLIQLGSGWQDVCYTNSFTDVEADVMLCLLSNFCCLLQTGPK